ncbi:guanylate kinase [Flammeovirga yaeyamensis]|uniref:Guanylate kinase n=1 Tax=Flammeovirga yaeyamensis TaxID=367791 RepID=A0AAX1N3G9_9BACT|nr:MULTISPECIES: guanylate kinase [Flammeovirga]ANQ50557.1 guanylate kinase [Flammeovirga sp. MY04]MBB3700601.1 guanylate kinase [Flammeovirga yaeyamensis]NMF37717.1 guanylate kinase [Flammeovirga yaeyamensis]QWG02026.1 guanylate kinase [Flammeovirga yaeyamensis]
MKSGKVFIFSAPSGSGKTTVVRHLLSVFPELTFSISATTRNPRGEEKHAEDYYFISADDFKSRIQNDEFVEYEEVYEGLFYGTLKSEIERIWSLGKHVVLDVDVIGGINLKKYFQEKALSVFVCPPNVECLEERLRGRATDSEEAIKERVAKAAEEMPYGDEFDVRLINEVLEVALKDAEKLITDKIAE